MSYVSSVFEHAAFDPDTVRVLVTAFESCREFTSKTSAAEEEMAKLIIRIAQRGVRDPTEICAKARKELGLN
jgi:hypothetical protein